MGVTGKKERQQEGEGGLCYPLPSWPQLGSGCVPLYPQLLGVGGGGSLPQLLLSSGLSAVLPPVSPRLGVSKGFLEALLTSCWSRLPRPHLYTSALSTLYRQSL